MKKTLSIARLLLILFIIEIPISLLFGSIYSFFGENGSIIHMLSDLTFLGIYRIVYSYIISIVLFLFFSKWIKIDEKISKLILINLSCLIITTILYCILSNNGFEIILKDWYPLNIFIFLSTLCSPIAIIRIPLFRTLISNIFNYNG